MAASVYATPPPDHLSGDETGMSDVSNSSQSSSRSNSTNTLSQNLSTTSLLNTSAVTTTSTTSTAPISFAGNIDITKLPSTIANAFDALTTNNGTNGQSSSEETDANESETVGIGALTSLLFDSLPENSKKRRKQTTPIRIAAEAAAAIAMNAKKAVEAMQKMTSKTNDENVKPTKTTETAINDDLSETAKEMPRIFLSNLSQLQGKLVSDKDERELSSEMDDEVSEKDGDNGQQTDSETNENLSKQIETSLKCDQCGLKVDSEIKLGLHILQEHRQNNEQPQQSSTSYDDEIPKMFVKKEPSAASMSSVDWENQSEEKKTLKPEDWLALSNLPFPFPPEAAAMLSASGYLSQLPLLGVPPFGSPDGLPRSNVPPLRIFNPEAYCDLCNKEFCNKYFLKTHKANKHNIFEPPISAADMPSTSQLNHMSQVFQMQQQFIQQSQQQSQQMLSPSSPPSSTVSTTASGQQSASQSQQQQSTLGSNGQPRVGDSNSNSQEMNVFCDICFKRFNNVFAMRRHRSKTHEIPPPTGEAGEIKSSTSLSNPPTPLITAENFREDYSIEQEDTSFTPQPRKLSPLSIQQAREANFSFDKLKRLGVINPEAFCELCCKEYCNKYFLRTHKIKRHGIFMPPDEFTKDERGFSPNIASMAAAWQMMQNAPLNLMLSSAEQFQQLQQQQQQQRRKLEDMEMRKSIDSGDDENEQPTKKRKMSEEKSGDDDETNGGEKSNDESGNAAIGNSQDSGDAISVDLQKLQSMIMQLNDLSAQRPIPCAICGKEQENQLALHTHMLTEHANVGLGDNNNGMKMSPRTTPPASSMATTVSIETCKHCDREFPNVFALSQHMFEAHGQQSQSPIRDGFVTPERPVSNVPMPTTPNAAMSSDRRPCTITPTSSYCEICNKELCNKYFMKTHMQRMHGIEIENGAQIGGVVCNVCNKELCSKYFLRVHKHNTHGIVDDGAPLPQPRQNGDSVPSSSSASSVAAAAAVAAANQSSDSVDAIFAQESALKHSIDGNDVNNRYFAHFNEICPLCNRRFRSTKWLRTHLMADHGKAGIDKLRDLEQHLMNMPKAATSPTLKIPNGGFGLNSIEASFLQKHPFANLFAGDEAMNMAAAAAAASQTKPKEYQCSFCSFSTPSYAFLFIHERSHSLLAAGVNPNGNSSGDGSNAMDTIKIEMNNGREHTGQPMQGGSIDRASTATPNSTRAASPASPKSNERSKQQTQHSAQPQLPQLEAHNILANMANLTQRPTTYAIPQDFDNGMFMQSFLLEPGNRLENNNDDADNTQKSRFVPSIVFLPVKERVNGKTVVSFTLTPA